MDDLWDDLLSSWWGKIAMGAILCVLAWATFAWFTNLETGNAEGRRRIVWWVALLYYIGGKWTAAGVLGVLGLIFGVSGIRQVATGAKE